MSRTGINEGIRRSTAAAAIGAVLVLTSGVAASQANEGEPDPGSPGAPVAVDTKALPVQASMNAQSNASRHDAPGQNRDSKGGKEKASAGNGRESGSQRAAAPSPGATPSASAVPPALRPAVAATRKPNATPDATPTASPVPTAGPTETTPPATSDPTGPAPAGSSDAGSSHASPAPAGSAAARPGTAPASASTAPAGAPAPSAAPGTAPAASAATGDTTTAQNAPALSASEAATPARQPGTQASAESASRGYGASWEAVAYGQTANAPLHSVPQTLAGWTPYATGAAAGSVRSSATLNAQPDPKSALVWLGSGLVGVAGAAGLVFFRLRNP
jgi:hypothetical protein